MPTRSKGSLTFVEAAVEVLRRHGAPMTLEEILRDALRFGLLKPHGRTPVKSLSARLYLEQARARPRVRRVALVGPHRAVRNSVRWELAKHE